MKPKTDLQRRAIALSAKLSPITDNQRQWAIDHIFKTNNGFLRKRKTWCGECGHEWKSDNSLLKNTIVDIECPNCGKILKMERHDDRKHDERWYYTIYDKSGGFQVLRHFVAIKTCCVGYRPFFEVNECVQNWISPEGKIVNVARNTQMSRNGCYDLWVFSSGMEVRGTPSVEQKYDVDAAYVYPYKKYIPELKRNGFKGKLYGESPCKIISAILSNPMSETLLKAGQISLLKRSISYSEDIEKYWPSIKICIRNNCIVMDASIYIDYLELLEYFGKDLRNAKYVCSTNMKKEHDRLSRKKHKIKQEEAKKEKAKKALENEAEFRKLKGCFFGIVFSDDLVTVKVLESVKEHMDEGEYMRHCVFSNEYYKNPKSLILTAIIGDKHVATIELSLETFNVKQCRAKRNGKSEYSDRIIALVNKNIGLIRSRMKSEKKSKKAA